MGFVKGRGGQFLESVLAFFIFLSIPLNPLLMAPKVKGLFKGFKYISQIFVVKEQEMEIGYPTDVRHLAHIGFDTDSAHAPSWLSKYKSASDINPASMNGFTSAALNDCGQTVETSWSSQDFKQPKRWQSSLSSSVNSAESPRPDIPKSSKKKKRKKIKVSSPTMSRSSSRTSFSTALEEPVATPARLPISYEEHAPEMPNQFQIAMTEPLCV